MTVRFQIVFWGEARLLVCATDPCYAYMSISCIWYERFCEKLQVGIIAGRQIKSPAHEYEIKYKIIIIAANKLITVSLRHRLYYKISC